LKRFSPFILGSLGGMGGFLGIGAGLFMVPFMTLFMRVPHRRAHPTSLSIIPFVATGGVLPYILRGDFNIPFFLLMSSGSLLGVILGTRLIRRVRERFLGMLFGSFLIILSIGMFIKFGAHLELPPHTALPLSFLIGLIAGTSAGLLGVGGGWIKVPCGVLILGMDQHTSQGVSLGVVIATTILGSFLERDYVEKDIFKKASPLAFIFSFAGGFISGFTPPPVLTKIFGVLLFLVGVMVIRRAYGS